MPMRASSKVTFANHAQSAPPPEICHWDEKRSALKLMLPEPFWQVNSHKACLHNEVRACRNRVVADVKEADESLASACGNLAVSLAENLRPGVKLFADMSSLIKTFPAQKRRKYNQVLQSLMAEPLNSRDWLIKAFVKSEKLKIADKDGDPRMIQARSMRFNLELGMFTKAVEKALYHLKDPELEAVGVHLPIIAKGRNLHQRAKDLRRMWELMEDPVAISLDLSRWDMHTCKGLIQQVMHRFYLALLFNVWFLWLLSHQLDNKAVTSLGLKYTNESGVTSGDMTTALGNCLAVIAILVLFRKLLRLFAEKLEHATLETAMQESADGIGLTIKVDRVRRFLMKVGQLLMAKRTRRLVLKSTAILFYDDGDDHVMLVERDLYAAIAELLPEWWALMGHVLKVEGYTDKFHQILFCQHKPFQTTEGWVMCPDPYKVMATSNIVTGLNLEKPGVYLETVWRARALLHKDIPVLAQFFQQNAWRSSSLMGVAELKHSAGGIYQLLRNKVPGKSVLEDDVVDQRIKSLLRKRPKPPVVTPEMRQMFTEQWGITPHQQRLMEEWKVPRPNLNKVNQEWLIKMGGKLVKLVS